MRRPLGVKCFVASGKAISDNHTNAPVACGNPLIMLILHFLNC